MADDRLKLEGQRAAIREHITKYEAYSLEGEKNFALKTIRNCQAQIAKLLARHKHWPASWEDNWLPNRGHPQT
ncbi:MAG: hypothetical protein KDH20_22475 [Rhodocyclaceae bacterium]|nr:hypothetical protein [Rhodocyclaceae bacterium]